MRVPQAIKMRATNIERRHDILAMKILAQTCFINCSPFLRVRAFGSDMANAEMDVRPPPSHHPHPLPTTMIATRLSNFVWFQPNRSLMLCVNPFLL